MRKKCRSHCATCGVHFTTDSAFDAHRTGQASERTCLDPIDALDTKGRRIFIEVSTLALCDIGRTSASDITVYGLRKDVEKARKRWGGGPVAPSEDVDLREAA